ncbi:MAG: prefoldin subunit alpha [Nanoarchaeota archaeon]
MADEKKQKYLEFKSLEQQLQQLQEQSQILQQQITELMQLSNALDDFSVVKKNAPMFVTLGNGVYAQAELKETQKVLLMVGAGVAVSKTIPEAKSTIEKQVAELQDLFQTVHEQTERYLARAQELQKELTAGNEQEKKN